MERLEKLINILKLTPHRQPELVKEASNRILSRTIKFEPTISHYLKPLLEILIQYCDNDDSAQRSLFNDYLNSVILTYQQQYYQLIIQVLLQEIINNGTARTVTAALQRIPHLINNVKPVELGCEAQSLFKALIEIARRSDDESVQKALDSALSSIMPFMDYHIKRSRDMQLLSNSLIEILLKNLQNESSQQTKRLAASTIAIMCSNCDLLLQNTLVKLKNQLNNLPDQTNSQEQGDCNNESLLAQTEHGKFVGFCLCVREIPQLAELNHIAIIEMINKQIKNTPNDITIMTAALETLRDLFKYNIDSKHLDKTVDLITETFLLVAVEDDDGTKKLLIKDDTKVILQANALSCLSVVIKHKPNVLDRLESILLFKNHSDIAIRNQLIIIMGNFIEASWRFPLCLEQSVNCERIRKLWIELRSTLNDDNAHPDTLKSSVIAIKTCVNTLLESDHCLHIVEYQDFDNLIQLFHKSNFKPFKIEVLNFFSTLNYRTLNYLERCHWSKMKTHIASSCIDTLQDRIVNQVIIASLADDHQRIRQAATSALVVLIPKILYKSDDSIVALANDLTNEHLVLLKQADEYINHGEEPPTEFHERLCIRNDHRFLSSSIIQPYDNPFNEQAHSEIDLTKSHHRVNITINLKYVLNLLRTSMEYSLAKGKTAISSIVKALYELSLMYPVYQYSTAWDCRASEYCECFILLKFLLIYMENLTEPDVVVEDLEAYRNFLLLSHQLLYALCHESVLVEYEQQKMKSMHKQVEIRDGDWSELTLKHSCIAEILELYLSHLKKLLWLLSHIIEERNEPLKLLTGSIFGRAHKKLESSYRSGKKNLNQTAEKFYQILETCLTSMSSLLEFIGMSKSMEHVKDILGCLKTTSPTCGVSSLVCARQLLKSLFGINILALYQLDPYDWFEEESWPSTPHSGSTGTELQGVYHFLVANPYKIFSHYCSINCSQITPTSDRALSILNFESRKSMKVRRRIEERVRSLFEFNPNQIVSLRVRQIGDILKNTITEFTPIVTDCMSHFNQRGFHEFQSESLHFMSYLILLRVNYQKLALAEDLISSINKLLDNCGEKVFSRREAGIESLLRNSFTFLTLLTYERGPSKPMFQVATVIQKFDDVRAKLSMNTMNDKDVITYVVPLLRCLVEDLFIYRTKQFQSNLPTHKSNESKEITDVYEIFEAERETVARKLLDVITNPRIYDLVSILVMESIRNSNEIKYKRLSQHLLGIIPTMLANRKADLIDYQCIELTGRIIEHLSPEVFQPVNFIFETLLEASNSLNDIASGLEFLRWMSSVIITMRFLITQVREETFLFRLREIMSNEDLVSYLLHIAQLCIAEIHLQLSCPSMTSENIAFLSQQLASYILYLTHMFQSGLFCQLSRTAIGVIKKDNQDIDQMSYEQICKWSRDPKNGFSLDSCEQMFYHIRLIYPDLTISWCQVMLILDNVDCNRNFWRNLLVYECHHCHVIGNNDQCLSPNIELTRRGALCVVLDFVTTSMNDVEHITWLIINYINDIIRWSHEWPIKEFISAVHRNSASSGILIQAINNGCNNLTSMSFVTRILRSIDQVHYTQYGSLVVLLVEKFLSSPDLLPFRSITREIEDFTCSTVDKLLNETNKSLVTTSDEIVNQVTAEVLDRIKSMLDEDLYPKLTKLIRELQKTTSCQVESSIHNLQLSNQDSDEDSETDEIEALHSKLDLVQWLSEQKQTAQISTLIPALKVIRSLLSNIAVLERVNKDEPLVCSLINAIYSLALNIIPPPRRLIRPKFWTIEINSTQKMIENTRTACLKGLFLFENIEHLSYTQFEDLDKIVIKISRLQMVNSFILTPPSLWKQNIWPVEFNPDDYYKTQFPLVPHDILLKDLDLFENFCDRLLKLGWINRRQFEEAWMVLLGVLSASLSQPDLLIKDSNFQDAERKMNLLISCKVVSTITRLLLLTRKRVAGDPLSEDSDAAQSFDERVLDLAKAIGTNLSTFKKRTQATIEELEKEKSTDFKQDSGFSSFLRIQAQKLRMMQDTVVIHNSNSEIDLESCIRFLMGIYKQKLEETQYTSNQAKKHMRQIAPPLATAICQSILALSDMFSDYDQFDWLFQTFVEMFKVAERNDDDLQQQYLIIGLCKSASVYCYEIPNELTTVNVINHRDIMFEKCRQSIEKCLKSEFIPTKLSALFGAYYMLEDSINIVASGAWELDHFKQLRQSRLAWIRLISIILDDGNFKLLTKKEKLRKLLRELEEVVTESETKSIKI